MQYPKEDEGGEWKEFKNLKNDFSGHEKDDVFSYVSALANMEGDTIYVGIEDETKDPLPNQIVEDEEINDTISRLRSLCFNVSIAASERLTLQITQRNFCLK